jgi:hypothetical protein
MMVIVDGQIVSCGPTGEVMPAITRSAVVPLRAQAAGGGE